MSRIGKKKINIPSNVTIDIADKMVTAKGPKGELKLPLHSHIIVNQEDEDTGKTLVVTVKDESEDKALWGTFRALLANLVTGVSEGFKKELELNGVGFKMSISGKIVTLKLGFSHEIKYTVPDDVDVVIDGNKMTISGMDAQSVGQVAAEIRGFKKPEPYKGKGFKYADEIIRRKVGKAAKTE